MSNKNSTIWMYQTNITPERNCIVDDLSGYLKTCAQIGYSDFQYQKIQLEMSIKIDKDQLNFPISSYNYVSIQNDGELRTFYYFVIGQPRWLSTSTVEYQLSMDTLNTFKDSVTWTNKTHITRQHKDRFYKPSTIPTGTITLNRKIDEFDEGISPVKTLVSDIQLTEQSDENHYLVYRNKISTGASTTSPIGVNLYPEHIHNVSVDMNGLTDFNWSSAWLYFIDGAQTPFIYNNGNQSYNICLKNSPLDLLFPEETGTIRFDGIVFYRGTSYTAGQTGDVYVYGVRENAKNVLLDTIPSAEIGTESTDFIRLHNIICNPVILKQRADNESELILKTSYYVYRDTVIGSQNYYWNAPSNILQAFKDLDRTDTQLIKIIKLPYTPVPEYTKQMFILTSLYPGGLTVENPILQFRNANIDMEATIAQLSLSKDLQVTLTANDRKVTKAHNKNMESKLKNSNFYSWKFYFDNFNREYMFERTVLDPNSTVQQPRMSIKFKPSSNLSSNFTFKFEESGNLSYRKPVIYDDYLNVNRQNEVAIYNSEYLNYIKTGYNYDKKALDREQWTSIIRSGVGLATAAISVPLTITTGGSAALLSLMAFGSVSGNMASSIVGAIQAEENLKRKIEEKSKSAASASATVDLDLLDYYSGFKLHSVKEKCSDQIENSIYDLFRLTGYACDERAVPDFDSRTSYNFIQCEPDIITNNFNYSQDYLEDFKARFKIGVTVYHKVDGEYDWNQVLENYETWIVQ